MERQPTSGGKLDILAILDNADAALSAGQARLAAHLYRAAFDMESDNSSDGSEPSERVLAGMHKAWQIALDEKDRSEAEAVLNDLMPFNDADETRKAVANLQELALTQLDDVGITRSELEGMARSIGEAFMPSQLKAATEPQPTTNNQKPTFKRLAGYDSTLEQARELGFIAAGDAKFRQFAEQAAAFHGIERTVMFDTFIIHGKSRDDVDLFAETTAVELRLPVLTMQVEFDKTGNGSIRMAGPFRRSPFGAPELSDVPIPCTLLINGIDNLQKLIDRENHELDAGRIMPQSRLIQHEIFGLLSGLIHRGDVYVVATACALPQIAEPLASLFGQCATIEVAQPDLMERFEVLKCFADDHPSFRELDLQHLAHLSAGASRHEIVGACRQALESAYRNSLKSSRQCLVDFEDLLVNLRTIIGQESRHREDLEDEVIALFRCDIDNVERELGGL